MAEYQRFVAYVYEYHKGKKGSNCGFIRVEARDGLCRVEVHLKCPGLVPNVNCSIYGFTRGRGTLEGYLMGNCRTLEGRADCILETDRNHMGGQEAALEQLGGMVLVTENGGFFGTEWDDQPIRPENFRENRKTVKKSEEKIKRDPGAGLTGEADKAVDQVSEEKPTESSEEKTGEEKPVESSEEKTGKEKTAESPEEEPDAEKRNEAADEMDLKAQTVDDQCEEVSEQQSDFEEEISEKQNDFAEETSEKQNDFAEEASECQNDSAEEVSECQNDSAEEVSEPQNHFSETVSEQAGDFSGSEENPSVWEPFCDGELTDCQKIGARDFWKLGRQGRCLRNNRFLQHGFYQFGHLLLCRNRRGQYMLGVPGGYSGQERYMANMFGFPWFKESSEIQIPGGRGGYWYRYMEPEDRRR